jgi:hypothetical protein
MIPRRRNLKGVLAGFLGTYTSRYSDYQGFWLFGFIVGLPNPLEIDLLGVQENALSPEDMAGDLARVKFREQLRSTALSFRPSVALGWLLSTGSTR